MKKRAIVSLGLALSVGGAVAAATGQARPAAPSFTLYEVHYEGSGSYEVKQADGPSSGTTKASFHWNVTYQLVISGRRGAQVGGGSTASSGAGDWSIVSDNGGGEKCSRSGGLRLGRYGGITGRTQSSGAVNLQIVPAGSTDYSTTGGSSGSAACDTTDFWGQWVTGFSHVGTGERSLDPLTAVVRLSKQELRAGKVVVNVSNDSLATPELVVDPDCGSGNGATCRQSFDWKGSVTFTKSKR